jgi:uncharacterized protein
MSPRKPLTIRGPSLQTDLPGFIIPTGTQVVLKASKRVPRTDQLKPAGSVAEVIKSPSNNRASYVVRFADGLLLRAKFSELVVRRREVAEELRAPAESFTTPGQDLRPYVIYRVAVGSRAFGLATEDSDEDVRGVYLPPAEVTWSLWKPPEQWESKSDNCDEVYWELEKFLMLALKANPNILETLWTPVILSTNSLGRELRSMREAFLSKHLYKTYSGYVLSQFRRMRHGYEKNGNFKAKHAMHLVRLLFSGIHALRTREILVDVADHRGELLAIRNGSRSFDQAQARAIELDREFQLAFAHTSLPDRPNYKRVNKFLIKARRRMVHARRH